jgi:hypothetical protein
MQLFDVLTFSNNTIASKKWIEAAVSASNASLPSVSSPSHSTTEDNNSSSTYSSGRSSENHDVDRTSSSTDAAFNLQLRMNGFEDNNDDEDGDIYQDVNQLFDLTNNSFINQKHSIVDTAEIFQAIATDITSANIGWPGIKQFKFPDLSIAPSWMLRSYNLLSECKLNLSMMMQQQVNNHNLAGIRKLQSLVQLFKNGKVTLCLGQGMDLPIHAFAFQQFENFVRKEKLRLEKKLFDLNSMSDSRLVDKLRVRKSLEQLEMVAENVISFSLNPSLPSERNSALEGDIQKAIKQVLAETNTNVGVCMGKCGADIIFAETLLHENFNAEASISFYFCYINLVVFACFLPSIFCIPSSMKFNCTPGNGIIVHPYLLEL